MRSKWYEYEMTTFYCKMLILIPKVSRYHTNKCTPRERMSVWQTAIIEPRNNRMKINITETNAKQPLIGSHLWLHSNLNLPTLWLHGSNWGDTHRYSIICVVMTMIYRSFDHIIMFAWNIYNLCKTCLVLKTSGYDNNSFAAVSSVVGTSPAGGALRNGLGDLCLKFDSLWWNEAH